jgi:hypothetical protein
MRRDLRPSSAPPSEAPRGVPGSEPPPTEEETRAAAATREALARSEEPLVLALCAAHAPAPLDERLLDILVARAIGVPERVTERERASTPQEREDAEALRDALSRGVLPLAGEAALAGALAAAYRPRELDPAVNEALLTRALTGAPAARPRLALVRRDGEVEAPRRARVARAVLTTLASVAALAAGVALVSGKLAVRADVARVAEVAPMRIALVHERSADDLFDPAHRFAVGRQSERVDRIARARAADLRRNRFAAWGVE